MGEGKRASTLVRACFLSPPPPPPLTHRQRPGQPAVERPVHRQRVHQARHDGRVRQVRPELGAFGQAAGDDGGRRDQKSPRLKPQGQAGRAGGGGARQRPPRGAQQAARHGVAEGQGKADRPVDDAGQELVDEGLGGVRK